VSARIARSLGDVDAAAWNALAADAPPFLRHEFLLALETSGCATPDTGWHPHHLLHYDVSGNLAGAMPLYLKDHSWGEFVFDFAWADAWQRAGFAYYPRLVAAVPFTPAAGVGRILETGAAGRCTGTRPRTRRVVVARAVPGRARLRADEIRRHAAAPGLPVSLAQPGLREL
jgi:hypothetical protein